MNTGVSSLSLLPSWPRYQPGSPASQDDSLPAGLSGKPLLTLLQIIFLLTYKLSLSERLKPQHLDSLNSKSWRRKWQPTPVLLPGKSHGQRSLVGCMQSMGSLRVGHNGATLLSLFTFMHWRRKWQPTPVFLPGESQGQGSLVDYHLWGRTESDTTKAT